jgi:glyoxylase-like metal-dependent hydrolase (beta-lactamase superfamily II)
LNCRVYYATVTRPGLGSNNVVVVNDTDVLIVDAGTSPAAARAFVEDVKKLIDKPIRYVINTHWHFDHTAGNQIFGPEVQIIATDHLRWGGGNADLPGAVDVIRHTWRL